MLLELQLYQLVWHILVLWDLLHVLTTTVVFDAYLSDTQRHNDAVGRPERLPHTEQFHLLCSVIVIVWLQQQHFFSAHPSPPRLCQGQLPQSPSPIYDTDETICLTTTFILFPCQVLICYITNWVGSISRILPLSPGFPLLIDEAIFRVILKSCWDKGFFMACSQHAKLIS